MEHNESRIETTGAGPIRRLLNRWAIRLFAAEDDRAQQRGWQVRRTHGGFGRTYRDPRWDSIRRCACGDTGIDPDCPDCAGTGVIRRSDTPQAETGTEAA